MAAPTATAAADAEAAVVNVSNDTVSLIATSDLTKLFYSHYNSGVIVAPIVLPNVSVLPMRIVERLKPMGLHFDQLDGFLQRAVLWDAGYIYSPSSSFGSSQRSASSSSSSDSTTKNSNPFLKVYTRNGVSMSAIAPSRSQMESAGCSVQICQSDNFGSTLRAVSCQDQNKVFSIVQCAIDVSASGGGAALTPVAPDGRQRSVWTAWNSEDRSADTIQSLNKTELTAPDVNVGQYEWSPDQDSRTVTSPDAGSPPTVRLFAIHTVPFSDEPPVGQCPPSRLDARGDLLPTLTIPCAPYSDVASSGSASSRRLSGLASSEWSQPQESKLLTSWLQSVVPKSASTTPTSGNNAKPGQPSGDNDNHGPPNAARPPPSGQIPGDTTTRIPTGGSGSSFNSMNLIPILVGALVLVAVAIGFVMHRKRQNAKHNGRGIDYGPYSHNSHMKTPDTYYDGSAFLSPAPGMGVTGSSASGRSRQLDLETEFYSSNDSNRSVGRSTKSYDPEVTRGGSDRHRRKLSKSLMMTSLRRGTSDPSGGGSATVLRPSLDTEHLKLLQTDPNLSASRISYDKLVFERVISRSSRYEVWLSQYEGEELAVKRLVQPRPNLTDLDEEMTLSSGTGTLEGDDTIMANAIEAFVAEIQITASLEHPNLSRFVGVAWARLPVDSLCLAMEYQPNGDLRTYVAMHQEKLSTWNRLKMKWAKGIASSLKYLHNQRPVVLHLELNSTHVLLSDRLQPKLIDFGERLSAEDWTQLRISGEKPLASQSSLLQHKQRSFPYWAAPEVLRGEGHLMASDVYSFGMLLAELDACKIPFHDVRNTSNGGKLKPFQMMNMVISGRLLPSVLDTCPDDIRTIVERCTDLVPARRPKMIEVVRMLELAEDELLL